MTSGELPDDRLVQDKTDTISVGMKDDFILLRLQLLSRKKKFRLTFFEIDTSSTVGVYLLG